jgi:hypothetical protein
VIWELAPLTAKISTPTNGASYVFGEVPGSSFSCSDPNDPIADVDWLTSCTSTIDGGSPFSLPIQGHPSSVSGGGPLVGTVGTHTMTVTAESSQTGAGVGGVGGTEPATATASYTVTKAPTLVSGASAKHSLLSISFSATLTDKDTSTPVAGRTIAFSVQGNKVCQGTTNSSGTASCKANGIFLILGSATYTASFAGDSDYLASSSSGTL